METYYTLLDIPVQATAAEIEAAYQRQRARYSPERVAELGEEFRQVAESRSSELANAHAVLADPARRRAYDASIGDAAPSAPQARSVNAAPFHASQTNTGAASTSTVQCTCCRITSTPTVAVASTVSQRAH